MSGPQFRIDPSPEPRPRALFTPRPRNVRATRPVGNRRRRSERLCGWLMVACAGLAVAPAAHAQNWHWTGGPTILWNNPANWLSGSVPAAGGNVFIGSTAAAQNGSVYLDVPAVIASLSITDGMSLANDNNSLQVTGNTLVSGANQPINVNRSSLLVSGVDGVAFRTRNLALEDGGQFIAFNSFSRIAEVMSIDPQSQLLGNGQIWFEDSGTTFVNDGVIFGGTDVGLTLRQLNNGSFNLDGVLGNGVIDLTAFNAGTGQAGQLILEGQSLSDSFSGDIRMRGGSVLDMRLDQTWVADQPANILMDSSGPGPDVGVITGSAFTFAGRIDVLAQSALSVHSESFRLAPGSQVHLGDSSLFTAGVVPTPTHVELDGVSIQAGSGAQVVFYNQTTIRNAVLTAAGPQPAVMTFWGDTQWDGTLSVQGQLSNQGDNASVVGNTTITADQFHMGNADSRWSLAASLTVNAGTLNLFGADGLQGEMVITGGFANRLTMNLTNPADAWRVRGRLTIGGVNAAIPITRVSGSRMLVEGVLDVTTGIARITADASLLAGSQITISPPATLLTEGQTVISSGAIFSGQGWMHNGAPGTLQLRSGASLGGVGLRNTGDLLIGPAGPASASVDRLVLAPQSVWAVDIRGLLPGSGHDQLAVTGALVGAAAQLGGELLVLLDPAAGGFRPQVGDQFTILTAPGGVSGVFASVPDSVLGAVEYGWRVIYNPTSVVLRVDTIVPAPGAAALLAVGGMATLISARRRRPAPLNPR